ncbi:MAG TPA: hypothetical protein VJ020_05975 [Anaerolineales bacterium]|nr:hypothetical protein [Anaerolineales bacterium]
MESVTAIILIGSSGPGDIERMVATARMAAVSDTLRSLRSIPNIDRIIVAAPETDTVRLALAREAGIVWDFDPADQPFHFGKRLAEIIQTRNLNRVIYIGAGSMPLYSAADLDLAVAHVAQASKCAITNNIHSADWVAFSDAQSVIDIAHWLDRDNMLAWRLRETAHFDVQSEAPSAKTRLDVDTPFDLQILALHPDTPPHLRRAIKTAGIDPAKLREAANVLRQPGSRVTLIGRVPLRAWQLLDSRQLWLRVLSEERGMVANTRLARGEVFSFLADYVAHVGEEQFIARLVETSDIVLLDTRVYLAHRHCWPPAEERFASDLGRADKIQDAPLKRLIEAVAAAPIPILLGGHNVVSGGLYALLDLMAQGVV